MGINIALDGPSGAGKSTIAKKVAKNLGYIYVDTGAMYRSVALYCIKNGIEISDENAVTAELENIIIELKYVDGSQHIILNGEDVSEKIRENEVSLKASAVSAIQKVRSFLFDLQKDIAKNNDIIMDGRDIGTVILPNANVKIFLTASADKRAERRYKELVEKGTQISYDTVLDEINKRDYADSHRETAPLKQAEDAILVDSSELTLDETVNKISLIIQDKTGNNNSEGYKCKGKISFIRMFFYSLLRPIIYGIFHVYYNLKVEGKENIPHDGGYIFASNHRSYADPVLISIFARVPFKYMAKEELFKNPLFRILIKTFGAFPVVRGSGDMKVIDDSIGYLNKGFNLVIFPEGTRSKDGKVGKGKTGVALIASKAGVPVVPVGINFATSKLKFRSKIVVRYGKPISSAELQLVSQTPAELKRLKLTIMSAITGLVDYDDKSQ